MKNFCCKITETKKNFFESEIKILEKITQEEIINFCHQNSIIDFLGVKTVPLENGEVRLELFVGERHTNPYGLLHGGVMSILVDTAMGAACLARNKKVVTISMTVEFMKAFPVHTKILTDAKIVREGRKIIFCECKLIDEKEIIYAKANATFFVVGNWED